MLLILLLLLEGVLSFFLQKYCEDYTFLSVFLLFVNSIFVLFYTSKIIHEKKYVNIINIAFLLRVILLVVDVFGRDYVHILHSGADSEKFHMYGMKVYNDFSEIKNLPTVYYTHFLGLFYTIFGPQRILAQFINVLFGYGTIVYVYKTIRLINIPRKQVLIAICIMAFMPHNIIFSSILLREAFVTFFLCISIYHFIKWYFLKKISNVLIAIGCILLGSVIHSGIIVVLLVYIFYISAYNHSNNRIKISMKTIGVLVIAMVLLGTLFFYNKNIFFSKFSNATDKSQNELFETLSGGAGGSSYLSSTVINTPLDVLIYSPLKIIYFLFSPLPWNWRSVGDVIAFSLDSVIYMVLFFHIVKNYHNMRKTRFKTLLFSLLLSCFILSFAFSFGTKNSGTAIRHRNKYFSIIVIMYALGTKPIKPYLMLKK